MKQCPNPNCILYTRLEELPDAYVKCPGCGGPLADANTTTSGLSAKMAPSASALHRQIHIREDETLGHSQQSKQAPQSATYADDDEYAYEDEYAYDDNESDSSTQPQRRGLSTASKVVFGLGGLMLVIACLLVASVLSGRLFARGNTPSPAQATETAFASIRPAVNTPISILPTVPSSGLSSYPTPADTQPTLAPQRPTSISTSIPQPTQAVAQPTTPPRQQTTGGILGAQMAAADGASSSPYKPNDTFHVVVQAAGSVTSILVRWYGPNGSQLSTVRKEYSLTRAYNADFTLKNATSWPPGNYRVDIHTNDSTSPAYSVPFTVAP